MPITVELPDGREVEVDTDDPQVAARAAHTFQQQNPPQQRQSLVPRQNPGALPWQQLRNRRSPMQQTQGAVANFNRGIPFSADVSGATVGAMRGGGEILRQLNTPDQGPLDPFAIEAAARGGYQDQVQAERGAQQQFRGDHPMTASLLEGTGIAATVAPSLMMAGAPTAAQATTRTPGLFGRMGQGASTSSLYGYAYGAGGHDQAGLPLLDRAAAGNEGAAYAAAFGAAIPPALSVANQAYQRLGRPAWEAATGAARRLPLPAPNSVGAMGGNLRPPPAPRRPPTPPQRPQIPAPVVNYVERNAHRERLTPDQLEAEFGRARANPQGQVLNDVFGENGVRQLRPIVQSPGETSRRAAEVMSERNAAQGDIIIGSLRRNLGVSESRQAAIRRLGEDYERVSAESYRPVFEQRISPAQREGLDNALRPYADDPVFQRAQREAQEIFARDRRNGLVQGELNDNYARWAHYVKMGLDDAVAAAPVGSRGLQATQMRGVNEMRTRIVRAIDENVPGYREARAQWGGLRSAEEALDEGAAFLRMNADEVQARVAQMTPFELEHARIGMADAVSEAVGRSGRVVGNANVANSQFLNSPEGRRRIAALFDTPEQAADFLGTVTSQNRLMRNAIGWNGGSSSYANFAHGDDNAAAAAAEGFVDVVRGDVGRAVNRGARQVGNLVFNGAIERQNNIVGEGALRRIDNAEAQQFTDELIRILREREATRAGQAAATRPLSAGAGSTQRDRQ